MNAPRRKPENNETNAARQQARLFVAVTGTGGQPGTPWRGTVVRFQG